MLYDSMKELILEIWQLKMDFSISVNERKIVERKQGNEKRSKEN